MKRNWIIIWHDRHRDDIYKVVLNATLDEANEIELKMAKEAGWENYTEDVQKYGYGDYGYNEEYFISLRELESYELVKC